MKKIFLSFFLIFSFCSSFVTPEFVLAKNNKKQKIENSIKINQKIKNDLENKINNEQKVKNSEIDKKNKIESEISDLNGQIDTIRHSLNDTNEKLIAKETELLAIEEKNNERQKFKERLRSMYEDGSFGIFDIICESKDVGDLIRRGDAICELSEANEELLNEIEENEKKILEIKGKILKIKTKQENMDKTAKEKAVLLEEKKNEKLDLIKEIEKTISQDKKKYEEAEKAEAEFKRQLIRMISILNSNNAPISKDFRWPTTSRHISSSFGYRLHPIFKVTKFHSGIDITAHIGEEVYASKDGTVVFSGWNGGYGNCIVVDHGNGVSTLYAHLSAMSVSKNIKVSKGNVIGKIGSTGCSSGPHLHFEILVNGTAKNPLSYL